MRWYYWTGIAMALTAAALGAAISTVASNDGPWVWMASVAIVLIVGSLVLVKIMEHRDKRDPRRKVEE